MPEPSDAEREQEIRAEHERADGTHASRIFNSERDFLLRLLDAARARADAAEAILGVDEDGHMCVRVEAYLNLRARAQGAYADGYNAALRST